FLRLRSEVFKLLLMRLGAGRAGFLELPVDSFLLCIPHCLTHVVCLKLRSLADAKLPLMRCLRGEGQLVDGSFSLSGYGAAHVPVANRLYFFGRELDADV